MRDSIAHSLRLAAPLLAIQALTVVLVWPSGDFPLNDDWVYAKMLHTLVDEGRYEIHPYTQAYALPQLLLAAPVAAAFGFSFSLLRVVTLVIALLAAWGTALCGRALGLPRAAAIACGALLLCNPLFMNLSYTYMTDVPFMTSVAFACLCYLRSLRDGAWQWVLLGTLLSIAAFFSRQFGILVPLAFVATHVLFFRAARGRITAAAACALAIPWAFTLLATGLVHAKRGRLFLASQTLPGYLEPATLGVIGVVLLSVALTLGLLLLPLAAGLAWPASQRKARRPRIARWVSWGTALALLMLLIRDPRPLPRLPNMLRNLGVGPLLLRDIYDMHDPWSPQSLGPVGLWIVTLCAVAAAAICAGAAWRACARKRRPRSIRLARIGALRYRRMQNLFLLVLAALLVLAPLNPKALVYYDRYLIPALIPLALVVARSLPPPWRVSLFRPVAFTCTLFFAFSIVCLHDYMAWNRARWQAIERLRTEFHAKDTQIDAGYEFNGMYTSEAFMEKSGAQSFHIQGDKGWWVMGTGFRVAMSPLEGYRVIGEVSFQSWLGGAQAPILILERAS